MDLPLFLETANFVVGEEELRQTILMHLKIQEGGFLQSYSKGSLVDLHCGDEELIEEMIKRSLEQINDLEVAEIKVLEGVFEVHVKVKGEIQFFVYDKNELK